MSTSIESWVNINILLKVILAFVIGNHYFPSFLFGHHNFRNRFRGLRLISGTVSYAIKETTIRWFGIY